MTAVVWDALAGAAVAAVGAFLALGVGGLLVLDGPGVDSLTLCTLDPSPSRSRSPRRRPRYR